MTGEQLLIPPFDINFVVYECECVSCRVSRRKKSLIKKLFFFGFLCPVLWFANLALLCYCQLWLAHDIKHKKFNEEELPTLYELDLEYERCVVDIPDDGTLAERNKMMKRSGGQEVTISQDDSYSNCLNTLGSENKEQLARTHTKRELARLRYNFLKMASTNIVNSHNELRHFCRTYALRSLLGILGDIVVSLFIVLICKSSDGSFPLY